jgi:hypothetical protein
MTIPACRRKSRIYFSRVQTGGANVTAWLRYLNVNSAIRAAEADDSAIRSLSGAVGLTFFTSYVLVPVVWLTAPLRRNRAVIVTRRSAEHPSLYFDPFDAPTAG